MRLLLHMRSHRQALWDCDGQCSCTIMSKGSTQRPTDLKKCSDNHERIFGSGKVSGVSPVSLTQEYLKSRLSYDPDTGDFTWKPRTIEGFKTERALRAWNGRFAGKYAGGVNTQGYRVISISGKTCLAHRLAFLYQLGELPIDSTDHINGIKLDNRWDNLRSVTHSENMRNAKCAKNNTSGFTGVSWDKDKDKWAAHINVNGKKMNLGFFASIEDAAMARKLAGVKHGYHPNHGRMAL